MPARPVRDVCTGRCINSASTPGRDSARVMAVFRDVLRRREEKGVGKMLSWPSAGVNAVGGPAGTALRAVPGYGGPSFRRARDLKNIINSGALEILQDALTCLEMLATCLLVWSSIQKDKLAGISKGTASRQAKDGCRDPRKNCLARQPSKGVSGENTGRLTWENHFILISEP